jgi:hypothetical protein
MVLPGFDEDVYCPKKHIKGRFGIPKHPSHQVAPGDLKMTGKSLNAT